MVKISSKAFSSFHLLCNQPFSPSKSMSLIKTTSGRDEDLTAVDRKMVMIFASGSVLIIPLHAASLVLREVGNSLVNISYVSQKSVEPTNFISPKITYHIPALCPAVLKLFLLALSTGT